MYEHAVVTTTVGNMENLYQYCALWLYFYAGCVDIACCIQWNGLAPALDTLKIVAIIIMNICRNKSDANNRETHKNVIPNSVRHQWRFWSLLCKAYVCLVYIDFENDTQYWIYWLSTLHRPEALYRHYDHLVTIDICRKCSLPVPILLICVYKFKK